MHTFFDWFLHVQCCYMSETSEECWPVTPT